MSFIDMIKIYFGFISDPREPVGFLSLGHILFVTAYMAVAAFLAIFFANKYKNAEQKKKLKVIKIAAIIMVSCELLKIIIISVRNKDALNILGMLPLFLCSIHLFSIPIGAFSKGKVQESALAFLYIFGILSSIGGTYLAGNYFGGSPLLRFDLMVSVTTHTIAGFSSLYVILVKLVDINKKTLLESSIILFVFEILAFVANQLLMNTNYESNYMFLTRSAGTPFEIINTIVGGNQVLYTVCIALFYFVCLFAVFGIISLIKFIKRKKSN